MARSVSMEPWERRLAGRDPMFMRPSSLTAATRGWVGGWVGGWWWWVGGKGWWVGGWVGWVGGRNVGCVTIVQTGCVWRAAVVQETMQPSTLAAGGHAGNAEQYNAVHSRRVQCLMEAV